MTAKIPFLDLRASYLELKTEIDAAVSRVLDSGWYILGPEVESFEEEFASFCEAKMCTLMCGCMRSGSWMKGC